ncbi:aminotransferase class I/II-fold pyridoxal phosphate-dependent enzyme [Nocardiopsis potens]|uniref:aminotransferase class I/II-fold pyridoxal phosphate-dependent enzyme n=1 Tax=Nocardiopsis potens TaxID=1246458 RepID=UPI0003484E6E|nr:aminotransferase class I/II-fold pyridoxal phosphate-dependent enzyme [Nocardiopsis potens]
MHRFSVELGKEHVLCAVRDLHRLLDGAFPGEAVQPGDGGGLPPGPVHAIVDADRAPDALAERPPPRTAIAVASAGGGARVEVRVPHGERALHGLGGVVEKAVRALTGLPESGLGDPARREAEMRRAFAPSLPAADPPPAEGLTGRFERLARLHPGRPAVRAPGAALSYGALARRAAALSAALRARGLGRGSRALILPRRDEHLVAAVLAAFGNGTAVALVDPRHPAHYIEACAKALAPDLVVDLAGRGGAPAGFPVMGADAVAAAEQAPPPPGAGRGDVFGPDDCAVVTFTSGTTGTPKAVAGRYASLTCFYDWMDERFGPLAGARFGMCSSLGHDPLQRDLMTPLFLGGSISVPEEGAAEDPAELAAWLRRERVEAVCLNPVLAPALDRDGGGLPDLRLLLSVGAPLARDQALRLRRAAPAARILNLYGSTETQRAVACFEVPPTSGEIAALPPVVPLGRGMKDTGILVVGAGGGTPRLPYETGEVAVVSEQLALGYLDAPAPDRGPFRDRLPGAPRPRRAYLTGDLGHAAPGLGVVGAGRIDGQVKISGHRVETTEVSSACRAHPQAADAATVAVDVDGLPTLVSFVVPADEAVEFSPAGFRSFLAGRLPRYAVPHHVVTRRALPLTANGKIDLEALRREARSRAAGEAAPGEAGEAAAGSGADAAAEFVRRHTGTAAPPEDVPLRELGIDSLRFLSLAGLLADGPAERRPPGLHPGMSLAEVRSALSGRPPLPDGGPPLAEGRPPTGAPRSDAGPPAGAPRSGAPAGPGPVTRVSTTEIAFGGRAFAHCCSNDYLGLGGRNADRGALEEFLSSGLPLHSHGSAEVNAHTLWHQRLAEAVCELHGTEAALLFSSAYLANLTALTGLAGPGDHLFVDERAHRSLLDGCVLSGARFDFFRHNDPGHLEELIATAAPARRRVVVTEGLFGIGGDITDLPALRGAAERHGCLLLVDEAGSLGQLGPTGRGVSEHFGGAEPGPVVRTGTLAKALGSSGGYLAGPREVLGGLPARRGAVYSTGLAPVHAFMAHRAARSLLDDGAALAGRLQANARTWREALRGAGLDIGGAQAAIVPLVLPGPAEVEEAHAALLSAGIYGLPVASASPGAVNAVRTTVSAVHDRAALPGLAERVARAVRAARP